MTTERTRRTRPVRSAPLSRQVADIIREWMRTERLSPGDRLPSEQELAAQLDVSRATVRSALDALVHRGLVVRRHGVGNFVSAASRLANHLDDAEDFVHLIESGGATAGVEFVEAQLREPDPSARTALEIEPGEVALCAAKVFTADNRPVIYCINSIPAWVLGDDAVRIVERPEVTEPLFDFLEGRGQRTEYQLTGIAAVTGDAVLFPKRRLPRHMPLLAFEETGYTADNRPIWHSRSWYPPSEMRFELVRRRSGRGASAA